LVSRCPGDSKWIARLHHTTLESGYRPTNGTTDKAKVTDGYSPSNTLHKFISGGNINSAICVWSRDGKLLIEIKGHDDAVTLLRWSKDGAHIFSGSFDCTVRRWRSIDGKELVVLRGHTAAIRSLCLTPNQSYIVSASYDYSVRIWDLKTNQLVGDSLSHDDQVFVVAMSPDGKYVSSAGLDKKNLYMEPGGSARPTWS
jgi:WD40 repeat protein